jgi:hypothetical protein
MEKKVYLKKESDFVELDLKAYGIGSRHRKLISVCIGQKYIEMTEGQWKTVKRFMDILEGSESSMN